MIALFDKDVGHQAEVKGRLQDTAGRLITTWPIVTKTSHMLDLDARAQRDVYRWVAAGGGVVHETPQEALSRIIELVEKFGDRPMDLADATLVVAAEALGITEIVSIDRDVRSTGLPVVPASRTWTCRARRSHASSFPSSRSIAGQAASSSLCLVR